MCAKKFSPHTHTHTHTHILLTLRRGFLFSCGSLSQCKLCLLPQVSLSLDTLSLSRYSLSLSILSLSRYSLDTLSLSLSLDTLSILSLERALSRYSLSILSLDTLSRYSLSILSLERALSRYSLSSALSLSCSRVLAREFSRQALSLEALALGKLFCLFSVVPGWLFIGVVLSRFLRS